MQRGNIFLFFIFSKIFHERLHKIYLGIIRKTLVYALVLCWAITQQVVLKVNTCIVLEHIVLVPQFTDWFLDHRLVHNQTLCNQTKTPNMFQHHPYLPILDLVKKTGAKGVGENLDTRDFSCKVPMKFDEPSCEILLWIFSENLKCRREFEKKINLNFDLYCNRKNWFFEKHSGDKITTASRGPKKFFNFDFWQSDNTWETRDKMGQIPWDFLLRNIFQLYCN